MRLGIRATIVMGFGIVLLLPGIVSTVGVWSILDLQRDATDTNRIGSRLETIGAEIRAHHLGARRGEKDFLLHIKDLGVADSKANHLSAVNSETAIVRLLADEGTRLTKDSRQLRRFENILAQADTYQHWLGEVVAAVEARGHVDSGAEGEFRMAVHAVEEALNDSGEDRILVSLLQTRRSEKDYLLRGGLKYIERTRANVELLKRAIRDSWLSPEIKTGTLAKVDRYTEAFENLLRADDTVSTVSRIYNKASNSLEALSVEVAEAGRMECADNRERLARTGRTAAISVAVLAGVALLVGIAIAFLLASMILRPIRRLTRLAELAGRGDSDAPSGSPGKDEVGNLSASVVRLANAVRHLRKKRVADSEDAIATLSPVAGRAY